MRGSSKLIAEAKAHGRPIPEIVTWGPFEMVGLHAAHGYAQVTGLPQAVVVHVDSGTLTLGGRSITCPKDAPQCSSLRASRPSLRKVN